MPKYEAAISNPEVAAAQARGEQHPTIDASWSAGRFVEVTAMDEGMARHKLDKKYPAKEGFVIESLEILD